jgi:glycosyltransferase involved in cell wall biosynthesis
MRKGCQAAICTTDGDGRGVLDVPLARPVRVGGVEVRYFPVRWPQYYRYSPQLADALRSSIPTCDLVHIHSLYSYTTQAAAWYCRRFAVPYLLRTHGSLDPYLRRRHRLRKWCYEKLFEARNLNRAAAVHFTTDEELRLCAGPNLKAPAVVVPLGIDPSNYLNGSCDAFLARWPELRGRRIVIFLGRINFKKGLDLLADAFARVAARVDGAHLVVAGPDDDGYGRAFAARLGRRSVLGRTTFTGMLDDTMKLAALRAASVFVLPSHTENFGLAVVEAMASGTPVIVSDRVNIWREIEAQRAGFVVPCDANRVADAIECMLADPVGAHAMAARARRLVAARFTWDAVATQMLAVYRQIIARHTHAQRNDVALRRVPSRAFELTPPA